MDCSKQENEFNFPFTCISDVELKYITLDEFISSNNLTQILDSQLNDFTLDINVNQSNFLPDEASQANLADIPCKYVSLDELADLKIHQDTFSILQLNCRSIKKNFDKLKLLLNQFPKPPDVILYLKLG